GYAVGGTTSGTGGVTSGMSSLSSGTNAGTSSVSQSGLGGTSGAGDSSSTASLQSGSSTGTMCYIPDYTSLPTSSLLLTGESLTQNGSGTLTLGRDWSFSDLFLTGGILPPTYTGTLRDGQLSYDPSLVATGGSITLFNPIIFTGPGGLTFNSDASVPEPSTFGLVASLAGIGVVVWTRRGKSKAGRR
ncbi:MAG: PEP-CTERM sorting domain-containing protein, partial [Thermoguttaceae bacterium]